jgi:G:T-mismatch repair DNA endonuclease (very short patch repair protein)
VAAMYTKLRTLDSATSLFIFRSLENGASICEVAEDLGITRGWLDCWLRLYDGLSLRELTKVQKALATVCIFCGASIYVVKGSWFVCAECRNSIRFCACGCARKVSGIYTFKGSQYLRMYLPFHGRKGKKMSVVQKRRVSEGHKKWWKETSDEDRGKWARNLSKSMLSMWEEHPELRKNLSEITAARNTKLASPNKAEKKLNSILKTSFPGEFKMNVKNGIVIGGKVPDFVNVNGRKVFVELFGDYWHGRKITGRSKEEEERKRRKEFKKWGFSTVIIWGSELNDEELVREKVLDFMKKET